MLRKRRMARARLSHDAWLLFFFSFFSVFFFSPPPRQPIGCGKFGATSACPRHWLPAICCSLPAARTLRSRRYLRAPLRARLGERGAAGTGGLRPCAGRRGWAAGPPHPPCNAGDAPGEIRGARGVPGSSDGAPHPFPRWLRMRLQKEGVRGKTSAVYRLALWGA